MMKRIPLQHFTMVCCMAYAIASAIGIDAVVNAEDHERIAFERANWISIPVEVFGNKHTFILDTGSSNTIFDTVFYEQLGGASNRKRVETRRGEFISFPPPAMIIGTASPLSFQSSRDVLCVDLSAIRSESGQEMTGVVGMDFLKNRVLRINPDEGIATLRNEVTTLPAHVERIRRSESGCPRIMLGVSNCGLQPVLIDTGADTSLKLEYWLFNYLVSRNRIVLRDDIETAGLAGIQRRRTGILDMIALGPHRIGNVRVVEDNIISSIGMNFLERFDTELDFPNERAYFRPSSRLNQPERSNCSGFWIERANGEVVIRSVDSDSVAEKADIREGDQILEVNGKSGSQLSHGSIRAARSLPGTELKLTLKRNGEVRTVTLRLTQEPNPFPMPKPVSLPKQSSEPDSFP